MYFGVWGPVFFNFWVYCIEDMDNFYMGPHFSFRVLHCVCVCVCMCVFFKVYCIEDMDNNSYHRSTLPLSYFWVCGRPLRRLEKKTHI